MPWDNERVTQILVSGEGPTAGSGLPGSGDTVFGPLPANLLTQISVGSITASGGGLIFYSVDKQYQYWFIAEVEDPSDANAKFGELLFGFVANNGVATWSTYSLGVISLQTGDGVVELRDNGTSQFQRFYTKQNGMAVHSQLDYWDTSIINHLTLESFATNKGVWIADTSSTSPVDTQQTSSIVQTVRGASCTIVAEWRVTLDRWVDLRFQFAFATTPTAGVVTYTSLGTGSTPSYIMDSNPTSSMLVVGSWISSGAVAGGSARWNVSTGVVDLTSIPATAATYTATFSYAITKPSFP